MSLLVYLIFLVFLGLILGVPCSAAILYVIRRRRGGSLTRPATPR